MQSTLPIPKTDIQDSELQLALLSLVEAKLIAVRLDGKYAAIRVSDQQEEVIRQFLKRSNSDRVAAEVLIKLDTESGKYNVHQLASALDLGLMDVKEFNALVTQMAMSYGPLAVAQDEKIWLKSRLPKKPMAIGGPPKA
jgi:hypothetical protein